MAPSKAFVVSVVVAGAAVAGAATTMRFLSLGPSPVRVAVVPSSALADRQAKLDHLSAALQHARRTRPPGLPAMPRFPHVVIPDRVSPASVTPAQTVLKRTPLAPAPPPVTTVAASPPTTTNTNVRESDDGHAHHDDREDDNGGGDDG